MPDEKNVTNEDIFACLQSMTSQNADIKNELLLLRKQITAQDNLLLEVRRENTILKSKNSILEGRVEFLEKQVRGNNIVFYNIEETDDIP